jgi:hypothetical protein
MKDVHAHELQDPVRRSYSFTDNKSSIELFERMQCVRIKEDSRTLLGADQVLLLGLTAVLSSY